MVLFWKSVCGVKFLKGHFQNYNYYNQFLFGMWMQKWFCLCMVLIFSWKL